LKHKSTLSLLGSLLIGLINFLSFSSSANAQLAPNIDQVWAFELANGQRLNLPANQTFNGGSIYSYPADSTGDQNFRLTSNGSEWNLQRSGSGYSISTSSLTPTNGTPLQAYTTGFGRYQGVKFVDAGGGYSLIQLVNNPTFCINIPGGYQNAKVNLWTCDVNDPDQRFKPIYVTGNPTYVQPAPSGTIGILQTQDGTRLSFPNLTNGSSLNGVNPNDNDSTQKIRLVWGGYAYTLLSGSTTVGLSTTGVDYTTLPGNIMPTQAYNNPGGRYGSWGFVDLGDGYYQIKNFYNPNYCLWVSPGVVRVYGCNAGLGAMKFKIGQSTTTYEAWLVARYSKKPNLATYFIDAVTAQLNNTSPEVGHAWIALVKVNRLSTFSGVTENYSVSTFSYWPSSKKPDNQNSSDVTNAFNILGYYGSSTVPSGVRKARLSQSRYNSLLSNASSQTTCDHYKVLDGLNPVGACTCVDQSAQIWKNLTGENYTSYILPDALADTLNGINSSENSSGYTNQGNIYP
jgi:hypothetical protein